MIQQVQAKCSACNDVGEIAPPNDKCPECNGAKVKHEKKIFTVQIEPGMKHHQKIVIKGEAGYQKEQLDMAPGDLIFILEQKEHPTFSRKGADLLMIKEISLTEALCGFKFVIDQLDGRKLVMASEPGQVIKPDSWKCINDEGMPVHGSPFQKGNLYVQFNVSFPESLSPADCEKLASLLPSTAAMVDDDEDHEPVSFRPIDIEKELRSRRDFGKSHAAYDSEDEDERGGQRVQCHQQ